MSVEFENDTLDLNGMEKAIRLLKKKEPLIKLGVLSKNARKNEGGKPSPQTNAVIAATHEFGAPAKGIPSRSFLRMPITLKLQKELDSKNAFSKKEIEDVIKKGSFLEWLKKVSVVAEGIVRGAFDTGGYGQWHGWKDPNYENNAGMLLVDTTQLRDSITSEASE